MTGTRGTSASQPNNIPRLMLALILSISAFIQFTVVSRTVVDTPLRADAGEYFSYAHNLHEYRVFSLARTWEKAPAPPAPAPDKLRSPGYPLFLLMAGTPKPVAPYGLRVAFMQAGLGVASVWLIYLIAAMFLGRGLALLAALITATAPQLAMISTYLLTESLFMFLLLASVLTLLKAAQSNKRAMYAATGILWGLCSLVRPTAEFFPPLLLLAVFALPKLRQFRKPAALAFTCFLLVMAPWIIRNQSEALANSKSGLMVKSLSHGSYPGFMYENRPETFAYPYRFDPQAAEDTRDLASILKHIAGRFREEPGKYASWYLLGKPYFLLSLEDVQSRDILIYPVSRTPYYQYPAFSVIRRVGLALHWPLMILGLIGVCLLFLRPRWLGLEPDSARAASVVALLFVYAIAFHMIVAPFPRYAIPFRPFIYALALIPFRAAWLAFRERATRFPNLHPSGSL